MLSIPMRSRYPSTVEGMAAMPLTRKARLTVAGLLVANPAINTTHYLSTTRSRFRAFSKTQVFLFCFLFFIKRPYCDLKNEI